MSTPLLAAPSSAVASNNDPAFGLYAGPIPRVDWSTLGGRYRRGALWQRLHAKRWQYASIAGERLVIGVAIVDIGWASSCFAYLFDRETRTLRADRSATGIPGVTTRVARGAAEGAESHFLSLGLESRIERPLGSPWWFVRVRGTGGFRVDARLDPEGGAPTFSAIAAIDGGVANCTQKTMSLAVSGSARIAGEAYDLGGCTASLDYTNGLLARDTRWRWASAASPRVGLNLVEGFNGPVENVVWLDGELVHVGPSRFDFDRARPLEPWHITTADGCVDLRFTPEGLRSENKNLGVAVSRYVQPVGTFSGTVRAHPDADPRVIDRVPGVTEDHEARW